MESSKDRPAKKAKLVLLACVLASVWMLTGLSFGLHEITLQVVDDKGDPVPNADAVVSFNYEETAIRTGRTNHEGVFRASGNIRPAAFVRVKKDGYYDYVIRGVREDGEHDLPILLRERKDAVPLIARDVQLSIPEEDRDIGFDFEIGDWVEPYGEGQIADLIFHFTREFKGMGRSPAELEKNLEMSKRSAEARDEKWTEEEFRNRGGNWDAKLVISVPGDGGGFVVDAEGFVPESDLTMSHFAPADGYSEPVTLRLRHPPSFGVYPPLKAGLFARTRIEESGGENVRANYTKILGGISLNAGRSEVEFVYYFNPRENDRNLEFDPKQNLARDQKRSFPP